MKNVMMNVKLIIAVNLIWVGALRAQTAISSAGGDESNNNGTVAMSFGQPFGAVESTNDGSVEVGVQHAYKIESVSVKNQDLKMSLTAFPNPTEDCLILSVGDNSQKDLKINLLNTKGELIYREQTNALETKINMNDLSSGTYLLNITDANNQPIKKFKIIKK